MNSAELKTVYLENKDIVSTSIISLSNFYDGKLQNAVVSFGGVSYTYNTEYEMYCSPDGVSLTDAFNSTFNNNFETEKIWGSNQKALSYVINHDTKSDKTGNSTIAPKWNQTWKWDGTSFTISN